MARLCPAVLLIQKKIYLRSKCGFILLHSAISRNSLIRWIRNLQVPADPQSLSIGVQVAVPRLIIRDLRNPVEIQASIRACTQFVPDRLSLLGAATADR